MPSAGDGPSKAARIAAVIESATAATESELLAVHVGSPLEATRTPERAGAGYVDISRHAIVMTAAYSAVGSSFLPP
jgi:predicted short-subunit dehydrogenase-like oxidoreductase (DUF2520 family)